MLGFYPIAGAPIAAGPDANPSAVTSQTISLTLNSVSLSTGQNIALTSQSLLLTQNSVLISDDDNIAVAGQALSLTINGVELSTGVGLTLDSQNLTLVENVVAVEVQPPVFDSQTMAFTLNSVVLSTFVNLFVDSQTIITAENAVELATGNTVPLTAETPLGLTLHSVSVRSDQVLSVASQRITTTLHSVALVTDQSIVVNSQTIYTTLNSLREWIPINTWQQSSCSGGIPGAWTPIPFDTEVYGDDFAIASEPLGCLPQILPPIRKFPGSPWSNVTSTTTTTWSNIQT